MGYSRAFNRFNALLAAALGMAAQQNAALAAEGPCDIYAAGSTPCVAAYSTVRALSGAYNGPLYQVKRTSDGKTQDILPLAPGGIADGASQDAFLGTGAGTISKLYDQSGKGNDLIKAPAGCYTGTASKPDNESNAKGRSLMVGGRKVYALYMIPQDGYRNNVTSGMPTGSQAQGIYEIADGKRIGGACCWDFGNASTNNCNGGTGNMNTLYFGTGYWGKGAPPGPWFLADLENGVWAGGTGASGALNSSNPTMAVDYAVGMLKTNATNYAIRVGNGVSGNLTTAYDGGTPTTLKWSMHGGIVLGIGGDNSNSSQGTFFEGAITAGRPTDATDAAVLKNIQAAGYGSTVISNRGNASGAPEKPLFEVRYNPALAKAEVEFTLAGSRRVSLDIYDSHGKQVANLIDEDVSAGSRKAVWDAKRAQAGVYIARLAIDGHASRSEKILIRK